MSTFDMLVNIDVPDLARAERFYTSAFNLQASRRFDGAVELRGASSRMYLLLKRPESNATDAVPAATRDYGRHWTPVHIDFVVDDIGSAVQKAVAAGATLERAVQSSPWGKLALLADPFGHGFCLVQFLGRGYDEIVAT